MSSGNNVQVSKRGGVRYYRLGLNQRELPSVTSVLAMTHRVNWGLIQWRKKVGFVEAERIRKESARIGELVHYYALQEFVAKQGFLSQEVPSFLERAATEELAKYGGYLSEALRLLKGFLAEYQDRLEVVNVEFVVSNLEMGYAGRVDCLAWLDGELVVIDIKTGKTIYPDVNLQLGAYLNTPQVTFEGQRPEKCLVWQIHPYTAQNDVLKIQSTYVGSFIQLSEVKADYAGFLARLKAFRVAEGPSYEDVE